MRQFATKLDNVGDTLGAGGFNAYITELENIVLSGDFALDPEIGPDVNLNMIGQTVCAYGSASSVLADSGSANSYALGRVASSNLKITDNKYYDGQLFVFEAGNTNTGASTVNVFGVGIKNIVLRGSALVGGEIIAGEKIIVIYDTANDRFDLLPTGEAIEITGMVKPWIMTSIPSGYLECDGSAILRTTYADLFALMGTTYGIGDGATTFNIPDYRGEFLRGQDNTAGNDPDAATRTDRGDGTTGDNVGTKQIDGLKSHTHQQQNKTIAGGTTGYQAVAANTVAPTPGISTVATGGNQTTPRNVNVKWLIKF